MQIFMRTLEGQTLAVEAMPQEEVSTAFPEGCGLVFGGMSLEAEQKFGEVEGLEEGSTLHVVPRLAGGGDGTPAMGKRHKKSHGLCPRCGKRSYHNQKKRCAHCGYPAAKIRSYEWAQKSKRRRAPGTGRMAHLKLVPRRAKNGFREGTTPPARKKAASSK
mmetsp:Transcript_88707/g.254015  ORF Transcript_88707/g.254015 Transcript_88707/m.254015 type:complete len:161 (-) Transcript_88707:66-548(-)